MEMGGVCWDRIMGMGWVWCDRGKGGGWGSGNCLGIWRLCERGRMDGGGFMGL